MSLQRSTLFLSPDAVKKMCKPGDTRDVNGGVIEYGASEAQRICSSCSCSRILLTNVSLFEARLGSWGNYMSIGDWDSSSRPSVIRCSFAALTPFSSKIAAFPLASFLTLICSGLKDSGSVTTYVIRCFMVVGVSTRWRGMAMFTWMVARLRLPLLHALSRIRVPDRLNDITALGGPCRRVVWIAACPSDIFTTVSLYDLPLHGLALPTASLEDSHNQPYNHLQCASSIFCTRRS